MSSILVTSYQNPDLDGTACSIAYAEFLQENKINAEAGIFGIIHRETMYILKTYHFPLPKNAETIFTENSKVILVDASDTIGISNKINPKQVVEIIDHRKVHNADQFPNAIIQIELVGSAATLITEKFYKKKFLPSKYSSLLLYGAIASNTINFQATVTTGRDIKMAQWLKKSYTISDDFVYDMFIAKSTFTEPLEAIFDHDFAVIPLANLHIGIAQLEFVNVDEFIRKNILKIKQLLHVMKKGKKVDRIFLTAIDIQKATNYFVIIDEQTEYLLNKTLDIDFFEGIGFRKGILMRKQIVPILLSFLSKNPE